MNDSFIPLLERATTDVFTARLELALLDTGKPHVASNVADAYSWFTEEVERIPGGELWFIGHLARLKDNEKRSVIKDKFRKPKFGLANAEFAFFEFFGELLRVIPEDCELVVAREKGCIQLGLEHTEWD